MDRLPLAIDGAGDDGSLGAETSMDGTAGSVDDGNTGIVTTDSTTDSTVSTSDHSDGTSAVSCATR